MTIMAYDPYFYDVELEKALNVNMPGITEILEKANFVTFHLPLNEETSKIINKEALANGNVI